MNGNADTAPLVVVPARSTAWKPRIIHGGYLVLCALAMIGWLAGLGWLFIRFANWLLF